MLASISRVYRRSRFSARTSSGLLPAGTAVTNTTYAALIPTIAIPIGRDHPVVVSRFAWSSACSPTTAIRSEHDAALIACSHHTACRTTCAVAPYTSTSLSSANPSCATLSRSVTSGAMISSDTNHCGHSVYARPSNVALR